jgi:hypothetical protein
MNGNFKYLSHLPIKGGLSKNGDSQFAKVRMGEGRTLNK